MIQGYAGGRLDQSLIPHGSVFEDNNKQQGNMWRSRIHDSDKSLILDVRILEM